MFPTLTKHSDFRLQDTMLSHAASLTPKLVHHPTQPSFTSDELLGADLDLPTRSLFTPLQARQTAAWQADVQAGNHQDLLYIFLAMREGDPAACIAVYLLL